MSSWMKFINFIRIQYKSNINLLLHANYNVFHCDDRFTYYCPHYYHYVTIDSVVVWIVLSKSFAYVTMLLKAVGWFWSITRRAEELYRGAFRACIIHKNRGRDLLRSSLWFTMGHTHAVIWMDVRGEALRDLYNFRSENKNLVRDIKETRLYI